MSAKSDQKEKQVLKGKLETATPNDLRFWTGILNINSTQSSVS